jgi:hypothetical protein
MKMIGERCRVYAEKDDIPKDYRNAAPEYPGSHFSGTD